MSALPVVAIIGRPNVGKSTLFNRLVGQRVAIVHDRPGVTRDRHYHEANSLGRDYLLVDTGGFDPSGEDNMKEGIVSQVRIALDQADVILCVLDATVPPTSIDSEEVDLLRRADKPIVFVANKCDSSHQEGDATDLYRLGIEKLITVSALHGRGMDDLEHELLALLPAAEEPPDEEEEDIIRVAVVGRPNAGKSSLINRLLGEDRLVVHDEPGTTRDAIDLQIERLGKKYCFVDTAGLRRKAKVAKAKDVVESLSVFQAVRAMERAHVVVLMCDADIGVAEQDAKILGLALDRGRAIVIALNKSDLLDKERTKESRLDAHDTLSFASWAPFTRLSAKTGRGVDRLLKTIDAVYESYTKRVATGELNRFFDEVLLKHPPPTQGGRAPRFYYITQAKNRPPSFMIVTSHPDNLHFSYQRYVKNAIRKRFGFEGTPLRIFYRRKDRRERKKHG